MNIALGIIIFIIGTLFGIFLLALGIANRLNEDEKK